MKGRQDGSAGGVSTLDFSSGHDPTDDGIEPHVGLHPEHGTCLGSSLPLSLSAPPPACALSLSFSQK